MKIESARSFNPIAGILFSCSGVLLLISHDIYTGITLLCIGGFFLTQGNTTRAWKQIPVWQRLITGALLLGAFAGLVVEVVTTFRR